MSGRITGRWRAIRAAIVSGHTDTEARLRFGFYTVFVAVAIPNMVWFGASASLERSYVMAALIFASGFALVAGWLRLSSGRDDLNVYRFNAFVFGLLVVDMLVVGGELGSKSLWLFTYPLIVFFLFGEREGTWWGIGVLATTAALLWIPQSLVPVFEYAPPFKVRLVVVYVIVSVVTRGFEQARRRFRDGMIRQQRQLEQDKMILRREVEERERTERENTKLIQELREAMAQVKTLHGLVPICSTCHRIRDDQGFWNRLEAYLAEHSDAQFTHGICPACSHKLYPEYQDVSS